MTLAPDRSDVTWARVDSGFYVGSRPGLFLGCVDRQDDGSFLALDVTAAPIAVFDSLPEAMAAVVQSSTEEANA